MHRTVVHLGLYCAILTVKADADVVPIVPLCTDGDGFTINCTKDRRDLDKLDDERIEPSDDNFGLGSQNLVMNSFSEDLSTDNNIMTKESEHKANDVDKAIAPYNVSSTDVVEISLNFNLPFLFFSYFQSLQKRGSINTAVNYNSQIDLRETRNTQDVTTKKETFLFISMSVQVFADRYITQNDDKNQPANKDKLNIWFLKNEEYRTEDGNVLDYETMGSKEQVHSDGLNSQIIIKRETNQSFIDNSGENTDYIDWSDNSTSLETEGFVEPAVSTLGFLEGGIFLIPHLVARSLGSNSSTDSEIKTAQFPNTQMEPTNNKLEENKIVANEPDTVDVDIQPVTNTDHHTQEVVYQMLMNMNAPGTFEK